MLSVMGECLAAQQLVAAELGIEAKELEPLQRALKWRFAEHFSRLGEKTAAFQLSRTNWRGAPSTTAVMKLLARLFAPRRLFLARRQKRRQRNIVRYGAIRL
jgi:hypothetical protein